MRLKTAKTKNPWLARCLIASAITAGSACTFDSEGTLAPEAGSPVTDAGTGPETTVDVARPDVACFPPNKLCDGICADFDDPDYGCVPGKCKPCEPRDNGVVGCSNNECVIASCEGSYWNCNGNPFDGCEVDLWSVDHCGGCGEPCTVPNGLPACNEGSCEVGSCFDGWGNCDSLHPNGCETDLRTLDNCGVCGKPCEAPGGSPTCVTGQCLINACDPGRADCNGDVSDGCETDLSTLEDCGACGRPCDPPNAVGTCEAGVCLIQACVPGFGDCNADPLDGCEINVRANPDHCGACMQPCEPTNASARACSEGLCKPTCETGWRDCNGPQAGGQDDGCERDVHTLTDCGDCDQPCAPGHAVAACPLGVCTLVSCEPGWDDCDHLLVNGCERNVANDVNNCGQCGQLCLNRPNSAAFCSQGACALNCMPGWGDCNAQTVDGCEVNTLVSTVNCGACGNACPSRPHATTFCSMGHCTLSCDDGWDDCNGAGGDGCEADLALPAHCGTCGNVCPTRPHATSTCSQGVCGFACNSGWADCNGQASDGCESDLGSVTTCGACNVVCPQPAHATATCGPSGCGFVCSAGFGDCNGQAADGCEANLTQIANCGACGNTCTTGPNGTPVCVNGACGVSCAAGFANCNLDLADGCEASLASSATCGSCNNACVTPPHATPTCSAGVCGYTCVTGWTDCDGAAANGCETDLQTSLVHCGTCGNACPTPPHAAPTCQNGACGFACAAGWGDCDAGASNGCEANLGVDVNHCGACGNACTTAPDHAVPACDAGTCGFVCEAGWDDCDGDASNGCETPVGVDPLNCGACGNACPVPPSSTATCAAGVCDFVCDAGTASCNGDDTDGCEASLSSPATCGSCSNVCIAPAHATATCEAGGVCGFTCSSGWDDCNGNASDGCESNLSSPATCGSCSNVCTAPANATATCEAGGVCGFTCSSGWDDCNGNASDGCESDLLGDPDHCGDCATVCLSGGAGTERSCKDGQCALGCAPDMEDCNNDLSDGCECGAGCCAAGGGCTC